MPEDLEAVKRANMSFWGGSIIDFLVASNYNTT
jgi:hypothetical protein